MTGPVPQVTVIMPVFDGAAYLAEAIDCDDADHAPKIIRDALGIESDDVANYCFPQTWPAEHERRARIIGEWLRSEARFLASWA